MKDKMLRTLASSMVHVGQNIDRSMLKSIIESWAAQIMALCEAAPEPDRPPEVTDKLREGLEKACGNSKPEEFGRDSPAGKSACRYCHGTGFSIKHLDHKCSKCNGAGLQADIGKLSCKTCEGSGYGKRRSINGITYYDENLPCTDCGGTGVR